MVLRDFHQRLGAQFSLITGIEVAAHYGDAFAEHKAICERAGLLDLSFRSRLCLTGTDRVRFLHGQVTNDVNRLAVGEGCYAFLVTSKGRIQSDLNVYRLPVDQVLVVVPGRIRATIDR